MAFNDTIQPIHPALLDANNVTFFDPETLVLLGGHFPWNLRPLRHYMERACFVVSIGFNLILTALLVTERNEVMRPYSRILLLNQAIDYVYACGNMWAEVASTSVDAPFSALFSWPGRAGS